jgi:hypothetical protein
VAVARTRDLLVAVRDRLRTLTITPDEWTWTIAGFSAGSLFKLKIESATLTFTASGGDTTTSIATAIAAAINDSEAAGFFASSAVSAGAVVTITGGPAPIVPDDTGTTGTATLAQTVGPNTDLLFNRVSIVPESSVVELAMHSSNLPLAMVSESGSQESDGQQATLVETFVKVTIAHRIPRDTSGEATLTDDDRGLLEMTDDLRVDLGHNFDLIGGLVRWVSTGADTPFRKSGDPQGIIGKAMLFAVKHFIHAGG